jgi:hypothetical protein
LTRPGPDAGCRAVAEEEGDGGGGGDGDGDGDGDGGLTLSLGVASGRIHVTLKRWCVVAILYDTCCTKRSQV